MPRKNRRTALVLVLVLLGCLAGQAAAALPLRGPRAVANESAAGDLLGAAWGWLADQWSNLGHLIAGPAGHAPGVWEKQNAGSDPNSGSGCHPGALGPQQP
jgi:hypothetical protein